MPPKSDPTKTAVAYYEEGNAFYSKGQYQEALLSYNEALRLDPDYTVVHSNKGVVLYDLGQYQEALLSFNEALRLNPQMAFAHKNKGDALYNLCQYQEALQSFNEALMLDPKMAEAHCGKGNALYFLGQYQEALLSCNEALRLNPKMAFAHNSKGNLLYALGQYQTALESYHEAWWLNPRMTFVHNNKGHLLLFLGDVTNALACYEKALTLTLDKKDTHVQIMGLTGKANVLFQLKRYPEAQENFMLALTLNPTKKEIDCFNEVKKVNAVFLLPEEGKMACHEALLHLSDTKRLEAENLDLEALRADIDREEQIRDSDVRSVMSIDSEETVSSSQFFSTDENKIAEKFQLCIQRYLRETEAEINLSKKKKCIQIELDTKSEAALRNEAFRLTLLVLLPKNSYTIEEHVINLPWSSLKDKHVRDFKKEFLEQESRLLYQEKKARNLGEQTSPAVVSALVAKSIIPIINHEFDASRKESEPQDCENIETHEKTQKKEDSAEILIPLIPTLSPI
jgi:tetratricopeptide (TPR) repeat protein